MSLRCVSCAKARTKTVIGTSEIETNGLLVTNMVRELTCISESGLYRILGKCNLPKCEQFEEWVFDEVLPSIRQMVKHKTHKNTIIGGIDCRLFYIYVILMKIVHLLFYKLLYKGTKKWLNTNYNVI